MLRVSAFFKTSSCVRRKDAGSVSVTRMMWTCKGVVNSALGENTKEPSSSTISTETCFNDDSNKETLYVNKVCQR